MTLLTIILPWLPMLLKGFFGTAFLCLLLQLSLIGWLPAILIALVQLREGRN